MMDIPFERIYQTRTFSSYHGICDNCAAEIVIDDQFWAVLIGQDEHWDYHLLLNFLIYCFSCQNKLFIIKTSRHLFEISDELATIEVNHENI